MSQGVPFLCLYSNLAFDLVTYYNNSNGNVVLERSFSKEPWVRTFHTLFSYLSHFKNVFFCPIALIYNSVCVCMCVCECVCLCVNVFVLTFMH